MQLFSQLLPLIRRQQGSLRNFSSSHILPRWTKDSQIYPRSPARYALAISITSETLRLFVSIHTLLRKCATTHVVVKCVLAYANASNAIFSNNAGLSRYDLICASICSISHSGSSGMTKLASCSSCSVGISPAITHPDNIACAYYSSATGLRETVKSPTTRLTLRIIFLSKLASKTQIILSRIPRAKSSRSRWCVE